MSTEESPLTQALSLLAPLTVEEKLIFLSQFSSLLSKEAKKNLNSSGLKPSIKSDGSTRKTGAGTYAWFAYEKEVMTNNPELYEGILHVVERRKVTSKYKKEHEEEYTEFVKTYKEDLAAGRIEPPVSEKKKKSVQTSSSNSAATVVEEKLPPPPTQATSSKEKVEIMKKKLEAKAEAKAEAKGVAAPPVEEKKKKSVVKKVAATSAQKEADPGEGNEYITVDGQKYIMISDTFGCFICNDNNTFGAWVGYYDKKTKKIRETESPC